jgi:NADPH:quinone reductase-like Zn-dependent oxidoreductase
MRAYGFTEIGGPDKQPFLDVPVPQPGPDELLVRVRAKGVNPGDWRVREGTYGHHGPTVLGREVAGTVADKPLAVELGGFELVRTTGRPGARRAGPRDGKGCSDSLKSV